MRSEDEIKKLIDKYEISVPMLFTQQQLVKVDTAIKMLKWVLEEE